MHKLACIALLAVTLPASSLAEQSAPGAPLPWFSAEDYPAQALRDRAEGVTEFALEYDAQGLVTNCTIVKTSGSAILDDRTCKILLERARFSPGHDKSGKLIAGIYSNKVRWKLPDRPVPSWDNPEVDHEATLGTSPCHPIVINVP